MQVVMPMPMLTPFPRVLLVKLQVQEKEVKFSFQAEKRHEEECLSHACVCACVRARLEYGVALLLRASHIYSRVCLTAGNCPLPATAAGTIHMRHAHRWDKCSETEPSLQELRWKGKNLGYDAACRMNLTARNVMVTRDEPIDFRPRRQESARLCRDGYSVSDIEGYVSARSRPTIITLFKGLSVGTSWHSNSVHTFIHKLLMTIRTSLTRKVLNQRHERSTGVHAAYCANKM